jgi:hypothetical protein
MEIKKILKRIEPFIAISIFIMLLMLVFGLYNHINLQKEIKENCGYSTNEYYCICYDSDSPEAQLDMNKEKLNQEEFILEWD